MSVTLYILVFLAFYHYIMYPAMVIIIASINGAIKKDGENVSQRPGDDDYPIVTFMIAAYNEEKVISDKIKNTLSLDYPKDRLEIMVVSDGSNDGTADIVGSYGEQGVIGLHSKERKGKTAALNRGVQAAKGEIIIFSDANNDYSINAVKKLVMHFRDQKIGGVCGRKRIKSDDKRESSVGDDLYWSYESAIKIAESKISSITTADGEIFAVRKDCYIPMDEKIINDDAQITFDIVRARKRVIYEPEAESFEYASIHIEDDFFVKVRMVAGGYQTVSNNWNFLFPPRSWFGFTFWSHKILRWLMPLILIAILINTILLASSLPYLLFLILQIVLYSMAAYGWVIRRSQPIPKLIYIPYYFVVMNAAAFLGLIRYLFGTQTANWRKAKR